MLSLTGLSVVHHPIGFRDLLSNGKVSTSASRRNSATVPG